MWRSLWIFLALAILSGCSTSTDTTFPTNSTTNLTDWYPTSKDFWAEYVIDSTMYLRDFQDTVTFIRNSQFYHREEIRDTIIKEDSLVQWMVRAERKKLITDPYTLFRNYSLTKSPELILKNEDNIRFVKIQAPIRDGMKWLGNRFIDTSTTKIYEGWNYTYQNINKPFQVDAHRFDTTLTVIQIADSNAIEKKLVYEVYAKGVGLVYSEFSLLEKQDGAAPWTLPENGYTIRKRIVNWKR